MTTAPPDWLLSAEEFGNLPDHGCRYALVRSRSAAVRDQGGWHFPMNVR